MEEASGGFLAQMAADGCKTSTFSPISHQLLPANCRYYRSFSFPFFLNQITFNSFPSVQFDILDDAFKAVELQRRCVTFNLKHCFVFNFKINWPYFLSKPALIRALI